MDIQLGKIKNRLIRYMDANDKNWPAFIPGKNWLLFLIADNEQIPLLDNVARICLDHNVLYVCGAGQAASKIDDAFDEEVVIRTIDFNDGKYIEPKHEPPMTTWHDNFEEGFWFAACVANRKTILIDKVICINLTRQDYKQQISNIVEKINNGWLPSDIQ